MVKGVGSGEEGNMVGKGGVTVEQVATKLGSRCLEWIMRGEEIMWMVSWVIKGLWSAQTNWAIFIGQFESIWPLIRVLVINDNIIGLMVLLRRNEYTLIVRLRWLEDETSCAFAWRFYSVILLKQLHCNMRTNFVWKIAYLLFKIRVVCLGANSPALGGGRPTTSLKFLDRNFVFLVGAEKITADAPPLRCGQSAGHFEFS